MRKQIAAGNWKMNTSFTEAQTLTEALVQCPHQLAEHQQVILAVPFPYLNWVKGKLADYAGFSVAAQNLHPKAAGAYTGEVSATMLASLGIEYVIIGHSERREYFAETNAILADKVNLAMEQGIQPIFCCGEPLQVRQEGTQNQWVAQQLEESLFHVGAQSITGFIIACEPIGAIGTGLTASAQQAEEMHAHIRSLLAAKYGADVADTISILYGGSVKADNAAALFACPNVDGGLVGGASLLAADFNKIIDSLKQ